MHRVLRFGSSGLAGPRVICASCLPNLSHSTLVNLNQVGGDQGGGGGVEREVVRSGVRDLQSYKMLLIPSQTKGRQYSLQADGGEGQGRYGGEKEWCCPEECGSRDKRGGRDDHGNGGGWDRGGPHRAGGTPNLNHLVVRMDAQSQRCKGIIPQVQPPPSKTELLLPR